jgi:hypothetical protein
VSESSGDVSASTSNASPAISRRLLVLTALAGAGSVALLVAILLQQFEFGSQEGGWVFRYYASWLTDAAAICSRISVPALLALPLCLAVLGWLAPRWAEHRTRLSVLVTLVAGFVLQLSLRSFYKHPLEALVTSNRANSFFGATQRFTADVFMYNFETVAPKLPLHARTNMPGKVLLYYFLELFTMDPGRLGVLLVALSTLGGLFVYLVTKQLTDDRRTAVLATALYCVIPGKLSFLPILNTVTPLLALLMFWLLLKELHTGRPVWALLFGASLYLMLFYEPLPFVLGLLFACFVLKEKGSRPRPVPNTLGLVLLAVAAFFVLHGLMWLVFRYDVFQNFHRLLEDARDFNLRANRPADIWIRRNLVEFFVTSGIATSMLFVVFLVDGIASQPKANFSTLVKQPVLFLALAFLVNLLVVDLLGINRGETTRLWIFLTPFPALVTAWLCTSRLGMGAYRAVLGLLFVQAALQVTTVGFINP